MREKKENGSGESQGSRWRLRERLLAEKRMRRDREVEVQRSLMRKVKGEVS